MDDVAFLLWTWLRSLEKDFATHYNHWSSNLRTGFVYQLRLETQNYSRNYTHLCIQILVPIKTTLSLIIGTKCMVVPKFVTFVPLVLKFIYIFILADQKKKSERNNILIKIWPALAQSDFLISDQAGPIQRNFNR